MQDAYRPIDGRHRSPACECGCNEPMNLLISPVYGRGDLPGYVSPTTGKWVEGRKAREEDLKRSGCRPYEGREQEMKEGRRQDKYADEKLDRQLEGAVRKTLSDMSPEQRTTLFNGD